VVNPWVVVVNEIGLADVAAETLTTVAEIDVRIEPT
jgi:hypothetical protein